VSLHTNILDSRFRGNDRYLSHFVIPAYAGIHELLPLNIEQIRKNEWDLLKSKISISKRGGKVKTPKAFTEKGLYMLATILRSKVATQTTIAIIETFAKIKGLTRTIKELSTTREGPMQKSLMKKSGEIIAELMDDDLQTTDTETSIELNFAVLKFKHTIKKKK